MLLLFTNNALITQCGGMKRCVLLHMIILVRFSCLGAQRLRGLSSQVEEINISRYLVISAIQRVSFDPAKMR